MNTEAVHHGFEEVATHAEAYLKEARSELTTLESQLRTLVRERPVLALLAAVGAGYVLARLASRH